MTILKSFGRFLGGFLLSTFLTLSILMIGLVDFTSHSNLKPFVTETLASALSQQVDVNEMYDTLKKNCINQEFTNFQLGTSQIKLKCSDLESLQTTNLLKLVSASVFDFIYYRAYDCNFLECLAKPGTENLLVLLSQHANNFLKSIQHIFWVLAGIGAVMMYFSIDTRQHRLRTFGINLTFSGASYFIFNYLIKFLIPQQILPINIDVVAIVNGVFGKLSDYFMIILFVGILLIISSYLIKPKTATKKNGKK